MWILEWIVAEMEAQKFPVKSLKSEEPDCLSAVPIGEHPSAAKGACYAMVHAREGPAYIVESTLPQVS